VSCLRLRSPSLSGIIETRWLTTFVDANSLARAEVRMALAHVLWHFDVKLAPNSQKWMEGQKAFMSWDKGELNIVLTPRGL
jgi:hypothetical protein